MKLGEHMTEKEVELYLMLRRLVNSCQNFDQASGWVPCEPEASVLGEAEALVDTIQHSEEGRAYHAK